MSVGPAAIPDSSPVALVEEREGARWVKGMRTMRKRLANRESKMATAAMADADVDNANRNNFSRPLHKAAPLQMAIFVQICNMCL